MMDGQVFVADVTKSWIMQNTDGYYKGKKNNFALFTFNVQIMRKRKIGLSLFS